MSGIGVGISSSFLPFSSSYKAKVLGTAPANLIGYWPMNEPSGVVADNAEGTAARDGAYTGVTLGETGIGDGNTCPLFDGTNDYCDIYSDSFRDAFDGEEGTLMAWLKVSDAGVWTDGLERNVVNLEANSNNRIKLAKPSGNNILQWFYRANVVIEKIEVAGHSETDWMNLAITWSLTADEVKAYFNGAQTGSTQTTLGTWAGSLADTKCNIGAQYTTPTLVTDGWLAHAAVWTIPLAASQLASLAVV